MEDIVPLEPIPGRKTPAQGVKILSDQPTIVFLTVCAKDRKPWMTQPAVQNLLEEIWRNADAWLVGDYLLTAGWSFHVAFKTLRKKAGAGGFPGIGP